MESSTQNSKENPKDSQLTSNQKNYMEVENHCCLCGTPLAFTYDSDFNHLKVREKAHCPNCQISLREKEHGIH